MNPLARHYLNARPSAAAARTLAALAAGALVSGCVSNPFEDAKVDPASPIAAEVANAARVNTDFPSFAEIPAVPRDLRPPRMFGDAAHEIELARAELERATAPETWTLQNTEAFAARARRDVGPELAPVDPRATEAYADELRRRATPPPPPKR
ncbi:hypothetical protein [Phenylobacterium sp.]|jgi:outer membrane murein-binding lipoprotein Lpp|uniref:hypothetical protein n=1 Tax=Phenylobacterium sp. TaxID=1871053 RepID=UPI002F95E8E8